MKYNYDRKDQVQQYKGLPKSQSEKEGSLWRKFLNALVPWIVRKWDIGNAFLEAKVAKEINEAEKIKAETDLLKLQAEKEMLEIIEMASHQDEDNIVSVSKIQLSEKEIDDMLQAFSEKLRTMYLKYGLRISVSVNKGSNLDKINTGEVIASIKLSDNNEQVTINNAGQVRDPDME